MPHTREYALRLLNRLDLPADTEKILNSQSYGDETVWRLFLDQCEEFLFHAPKDALRMAEVALRLSRAVPERHRTEDKRKQRELLARTHAILGGAYRQAGRFEDAERSYDEAFKLSKGLSRSLKAMLCRWLAYLKVAQSQLEEALELAEKAIAQAESPNEFGGALNTRGFAYVKLGRYSEAVRDFSKALSIIKPIDSRSQRVRYSATHNLGFAIAQRPSPESMGDARYYLREAKRLLRDQRRSINRFQLYWIEGKILIKIGSGRRGEKLLKKARAGFIDVGAPFELALLDLDLARLYRDECRWQEMEELASETFERFQSLSADSEAIDALTLWTEAAREREVEAKLFADIESTLAERMRHYPPPGIGRRRRK